MLWARLLAYVTRTVNQELLLRNEYRAAENRILRGQIKGRLLLSEGEKATLAEIAHRLGRMVLEEVAATAKPDTILGWYRKLIAKKFAGSKFRRRVGRPKVDQETERLVVKMARENPSWGYDRIVGALANLGHRLSDQTVGNALRRHLESRQVKLAGFTPYPDQEWMEQQARNMTMEEWGSLRGCCYLLRDRDAKFCPSFENGSRREV